MIHATELFSIEKKPYSTLPTDDFRRFLGRKIILTENDRHILKKMFTFANGKEKQSVGESTRMLWPYFS